MIKIGYQGEIGSNSEEAAMQFAFEQGFLKEECEFVPLIESRYVVSELKRQKIDYGVVATRNSVAGTVKETYEAIKDEYFQLVATVILPIHHCLFIKKGCNLEQIDTVTSHIQALEQTRNTRNSLFPNWIEKEANDTASAARNLNQGILPENYAVICRKNAGERYELKLVSENLEDERNNRTEFRVYKLPTIDYTEENKPSLREQLSYQFTSENGVGYVAKFIMILSIFFSILISQKLSESALEIALTVGGYAAAIILFVTSNSFKGSYRYRSLEGYWKYYPMSNKDLDGKEQKFTTPRIVRIIEEDGELKLRGVICDKENVPMFESKSGEVFVSQTGKSKGGLVYSYESPASSSRTQIKGIAYVTWRTKHPAAKINILKGMYYGTLTGDEGTLTYLRITKEEYDAHRNSTFI